MDWAYVRRATPRGPSRARRALGGGELGVRLLLRAAAGSPPEESGAEWRNIIQHNIVKYGIIRIHIYIYIYIDVYVCTYINYYCYIKTYKHIYIYIYILLVIVIMLLFMLVIGAILDDAGAGLRWVASKDCAERT